VILFAVPRHIRDRKGAGNWKDVEATQILLDRLGRAYERVDFDPETPGDLLHGRSRVRELLVHYSWWPDALRQARHNMPSAWPASVPVVSRPAVVINRQTPPT